MAFFLFGRRKGKREEDKAVQKEKALLTSHEFKHTLLEAAYYHTKQFHELKSKDTEATRSCAFFDGYAALRCYLQYLCWVEDGRIVGTRDIPTVAKRALSGRKDVDRDVYNKLLSMSEKVDTLYSDIGISVVGQDRLDVIAELIAKLDIVCGSCIKH